MDAFNLTNDTVLITGGGTGLGLGTAHCLTACGAKVILVGRRESVLQEAVKTVGDSAHYIVHDVTNLAANAGMVEQAEAEYGPIHHLINNAGVHLKKPIEAIDDDEFQTVQQTHVNAAFSLSRECAKRMLDRGRGHILFIASMASYMGIPKVSAYSAAKSAHLGLVRALAADLSPRGIRVNAIAPGWIHSEMMHKAVNADPQRKEKILSRTPLNRFGDPADIGWAATYLCSPAAKFITGVSLPVDGGASIGF
ncbi:MAG: SDR family NAD(P)-dependent oxidoreductase [Puniceicoccaceae bacterium]